MTKILLISLFLPRRNATHAGSRHVYDIISHLSERHEVHLVTRVAEDEGDALCEIQPFCRKIYPFYYKTDPSGIPGAGRLRRLGNYLSFGRFADRISRDTSIDLVQVEWTGAGLLVKRRNAPLVLDALDVMTKPAFREADRTHGIRRFAKWLAYLGTRETERWIMNRCDVVLTVSDFDRHYLSAIAPAVQARTVPIVADCFTPGCTYTRRPQTILFLASFRHRRINVEAALHFHREVFPLVRREIPEAQYIIAGFGPPPELTTLAETDTHVTVTGFVDDLERTYAEAAVFVAPILVGGGLIVKILEAMAAGTPVVTTAFGNEGVGGVPGRDLLVADDPKDFAAAVTMLLRDPGKAKLIGESGRAFVAQHYSREAVFAALDAAHGELGIV